VQTPAKARELKRVLGNTAVRLRDVGVDESAPVADGIGEGAKTRFTGKTEKVTIEVK
jgi:hypothetical protein